MSANVDSPIFGEEIRKTIKVMELSLLLRLWLLQVGFFGLLL
jgi:hypothetical protein